MTGNMLKPQLRPLTLNPFQRPKNNQAQQRALKNRYIFFNSMGQCLTASQLIQHSPAVTGNGCGINTELKPQSVTKRENTTIGEGNVPHVISTQTPTTTVRPSWLHRQPQQSSQSSPPLLAGSQGKEPVSQPAPQTQLQESAPTNVAHLEVKAGKEESEEQPQQQKQPQIQEPQPEQQEEEPLATSTQQKSLSESSGPLNWIKRPELPTSFSFRNKSGSLNSTNNTAATTPTTTIIIVRVFLLFGLLACLADAFFYLVVTFWLYLSTYFL